MQEGRLFQIVYHLLAKGKTTIPELAKKFEVSERTICRDVDALSAAGIPVYVERGRNGGVRLLEDFVLSRELLSESERKELLSALKSLSAAGAYDAALFQKLSALFQVSSEEWYEVDFSRWGEQTRDNEKFELLKRAVIYRRCVRIIYAGTDGEENLRTVWPLKLSYKSRAWYLKAWCTHKKDFRLFKLNRILKWELLEERFSPPDDLRKENKGKLASSEARPEPLVRLRFPRRMAYRVFDEFEESQVTRMENGDFLVTAPMPVDEWLISFLLSFGTQVEVEEPVYLREILAAKAAEMHRKYRDVSLLE